MRAQHTLTVLARLPEQLQPLAEMTADLSRLFDARVIDLFREIDPTGVRTLGLDPLNVLARLPQVRLDELAADADFVRRAHDLLAALKTAESAPRWFSGRGDTALRTVAYLSPEFGIAASVPQYSGGLGVLAGDHLKAANDLGIPLVGVGLFYRRGYFQQHLDRTNRQQEQFPDLHPEALALTQVPNLQVEVPIGSGTVRANVWRANVGNVPLYLLDTAVDGDSANNPDQLVTDRLYGGHEEDRIKQELLLGVGGYRALDALGILPEVFHLNEGHAGFAALEAIRRAMTDHGLSFAEAIEAIRPSVVFTTHTPVPAGIDRFSRGLVEKYLGWWCDACGITVDDLMAIGLGPDGDTEMFNLAAMCLRLAGSANGVAKLHGVVSREMFNEVWPGTPVDEVPISSVTNGVHAATWVSTKQGELLSRYLGPDWANAAPERWTALSEVSHSELWAVRNDRKERLVEFARERARSASSRRGLRDSELRWCDSLLDPEALTIGFARRFATYKRATLLLRDPARFRAMLLDLDRPVQFVFAGKAHPADEPGKNFIHQIASFASSPEIRDRIVFIENYDIDAGRALTQGVDVWLNTPLRPMEACGTSGMKASLNGALNCSVLDGWWDELFRPDAGWAIPSDDANDDQEVRDDRESAWLFDLLEQEVIPSYYDRGPDGIPHDWMARVKANLIHVAPQVTASRMMRDYVEGSYVPAAARTVAARDGGFALAREVAEWRTRVTNAWSDVKVTHVEWPARDATLGQPAPVGVSVDLDGLDTHEVEVQLLSGPVDSGGELSNAKITVLDSDGRQGSVAHFSGLFTSDQAGAAGLAVRVVPRHRGLAAWTDLRLVRWA